MLRALLLVLAAVLFLVGLVLVASGAPHAWPLLAWGGVLLLAVLFERWRYRPPEGGAGRWQDTPERFIDPQSGQALQVQFNVDTGERRYVPARRQDPA